jgi:hypothetical protein
MDIALWIVLLLLAVFYTVMGLYGARGRHGD